MGDLSAHFSRFEFACRCGCGFDTVDAELLEVLEALRAHYGGPVTITSAARCPEHNRLVGGAMPGTFTRGSRHLYGQAADLVVSGVYEGQVADHLDARYPERYGIGRYKGRTHLDIRPERARWGTQGSQGPSGRSRRRDDASGSG